MMLTTVVRIVVCALLGIGILAACRWIRRRDARAATVVEAGVLLRLAVGLALFWISYLDLPFLRGLHSGDGLWEPDARSYFDAAALAARDGLHTVGDWSASPSYVKALALWMQIVGVSPASGLYLNLVAYIGSALLVVAASGRELSGGPRIARLLVLASFSFSPGLVLAASEPLKDQFFSFCLVVCSIAAMAWLPPLVRGVPAAAWGRIALAFAATCAAIYLMAGIRPYVPFLCIVAVAAALAVYVRPQRGRQAAAFAAVAIVAVVILWGSFARGAGAYYPYYESKVLGLVGISRAAGSAPGATIESAREGFVRSGGGTNLVRRRSPASHDGSLSALLDRVETLAFGLAVMTVPVTILERTSDVRASGGHGLLFVIDVDTIFLDLSCAAAIACVIRERRRIRGSGPYVVYLTAAAAITALLMAYIVTNLGTLFRLRLIPATLIWLLPLALAVREAGAREVTARSEAGDPAETSVREATAAPALQLSS